MENAAANKSSVVVETSKTEDPVQTIYHTVSRGEYLGKIAGKYDVSIKEIKKWNNLKSDRLNVGQELIINSLEPQTKEVSSSKAEPYTPEVSRGYYRDGQLRDMGVYAENGAKIGIWEYYHSNGTIREIGSYSEGLKTGIWKNYYEDGTLESTGEFVKGEQNGAWKFYHENGKIKSDGHYANGKINGEWKFYHENGNLKTTGMYKDFKKTGEWPVYDEEGNLINTKYY